MRPNKSILLTLIYDARYRSIIFQVFLLFSIVFGIWWLVDNTVTNLAAQNKGFGFGFLSQTSGFQIGQTLGTWMFDYEVGKSTYLDVYYIGIVNIFSVHSLLYISKLDVISRFLCNYSSGILPFCDRYRPAVRNLRLFQMLWGLISPGFMFPAPCRKMVSV